MSRSPTTDHDTRPQDSERNEVLNAVAARWNKFSRKELADLRTNDDLVTQLVARYGMDELAAQRAVDALMNGRRLAA